MPKQPAVSIKTETYLKVKEHCDKEGIPVSAFIDKLCQSFLEEKTIFSLEELKKGNNR